MGVRRSFALAIMPALFLGSAAAAQTVPVFTDQPQIVTTAQADARVTPDRAAINLGVETRGATAAAASAENARKQRAIIDTLRAMGIPQAQITTVNYSVSPDMRHDPEGRTPPRVIGYVVSNTVRAELRRIDQVGPAIDAALKKGANQVNGIEFIASAADSARREALASAVSKARAEAEVLARAAGGSLGALIELSSTGPVYRPMYAARGQMMDMAQASAAPTPIEPGEQTITAHVSARWRFVAGGGR